MRMIHCADLHLDSALNTHLSPIQAQQRRNEILLCFQDMVRFAQKQNVQVIMIAGDLFDSGIISNKTKQILLSCFRDHPEIDFLYLSGNHDESAVFHQNEIPDNLKIFSEHNRAFRYGSVVITGLVANHMAETLDLQQTDTNIVMMHGQVIDKKGNGTDLFGSQNSKQNGTESDIIDLSLLRNKYIDYLALGHIHSASKVRLDERGIYRYSGCLEPRGFDEIGEKGFLFLDTEPKLRSTFVSFAKRQAHLCNVDISGAVSTPQVSDLIDQSVHAIEQKDMVKIILTGEIIPDAHIDLNYLRTKYEHVFFACKIEDATRLKIDLDQFLRQDSFHGSFVKLVMESDEDEQSKRDMIRMGLSALAGEEIHV